jgi:hypothetical protein
MSDDGQDDGWAKQSLVRTRFGPAPIQKLMALTSRILSGQPLSRQGWRNLEAPIIGPAHA